MMCVRFAIVFVDSQLVFEPDHYNRLITLIHAITAIPDVIFRFRLGDKPHLLEVDAQVEVLLGFPRHAWLDQTPDLFDCIHADDQDMASFLLTPGEHACQGVFNLRVRHADGRIRCCRAVYSKTPESDGCLLTLRLQDARSLPRTLDDAASSANFRAMMENTNDFIYFKDRNHVLTGASQTQGHRTYSS